MSLLIWLKGTTTVSQVNSESGYLENWLISSPVSAYKFAVVIDNDLTSKSQVTIEPCVPEATTIELYSKLLVATSVVHLSNWG